MDLNAANESANICACRDQRLNDKAHERLIVKETQKLSKLSIDVNSKHLHALHYTTSRIKDKAIIATNQNIKEIFEKKMLLIIDYARVVLSESANGASCDTPDECKVICEVLRNEIVIEMQTLNHSLQSVQAERGCLLANTPDLQRHFLLKEQKCDQYLGDIYQLYNKMLQKFFVRYIDSAEYAIKKFIDTLNLKTYDSMIRMPILFLKKFFTISRGISIRKMSLEKSSREQITALENLINCSHLSSSVDSYKPCALRRKSNTSVVI